MKFTSIALLALAGLAIAQDAPDAGANSGAVTPAANGAAPPADTASASPDAAATPAAGGDTPSPAGGAAPAGSPDVTVTTSAAGGNASPSPSPAADAAASPAASPDSGSAPSAAASGASPPPSPAGTSSASPATSPSASPVSSPAASPVAAAPAPQGGVYQIIPASGTSTTATHLINIARDEKLTFEPAAIRPKGGDTVRFNFLTGNHTIVSANWETPCVDNGVWNSAAHPMQYNNGVGYVDFHVVSAGPIWFFSKNKDECKQGMVFAMNPNNDGQLASYVTRSKKFSGKKGKRSQRVKRGSVDWEY